MPIINVKINCMLFAQNEKWQALDEIAKRLTESTVKVLEKSKGLVVVNIDADSGSSWYVKGERQESMPLYEVKVKVTEGTNTQEQVSTWIREAYETMQQILGKTKSPGYISVHQVPKQFWGYDGLTQHGREKWHS